MGMRDESWCKNCGESVTYTPDNDSLCGDCQDEESFGTPKVMWAKYTFVCDPDECDALCEFTARDGYGFPNGIVSMQCPCGREMMYISVEEIQSKFYEPVIKVTPPRVVKINSNPYN